MARTFGYPIFKTESLDDMPFEQYRVLIKILDKMHGEREELENNLGSEEKSTSVYTNNGMVKQTMRKGKTFRIINEP